jgi:hypothetical protein
MPSLPSGLGIIPVEPDEGTAPTEEAEDEAGGAGGTAADDEGGGAGLVGVRVAVGGTAKVEDGDEAGGDGGPAAGSVLTQYVTPSLSEQLLTAGLICKNCVTVMLLAWDTETQESPSLAVMRRVQAAAALDAISSARTGAIPENRTRHATDRVEPYEGAILLLWCVK